MSTYNARRAPNVSQYIANLNTIPSAAESAAQPDFGAFQDELDLFTNTQFFDFDLDESAPKMSNEIPFTPADQPRPQQNQPTLGQDPKGINFVNRESTYFCFSPSVHHPVYTTGLLVYYQWRCISSSTLPTYCLLGGFES